MLIREREKERERERERERDFVRRDTPNVRMRENTDQKNFLECHWKTSFFVQCQFFLIID